MIVEAFVKNMVCNRCIKVLRNELLEAGLDVREVELGRVVYASENIENDTRKLHNVLRENDFELLQNADKILVEQVKLSLIKLLEKLPVQKSGTLSSYLSKETETDYSRLSRIFSYTENITLEKYFIKLKIEKVKELIQSRAYNFTEISQLLDYSNVNYLSRQFKAETGMNLSEYKGLDKNFRNSLDKIV
ncbi:Helix-turn-helix domain-containing protein [Salegentibacter echinorum]|uniref:Helix-turn-helix domain-containing protein n=1 Tax=Salegentibacter echinorum TaxID=1073325 RepID=A0A1M5IMA6_SALEC|nr:AraC family transcriptional regulator [Salegentibacter echinorum]SHG29385.1 Helix-turn-helix domain-containing protein [Salegentibacter echinorum]